MSDAHDNAGTKNETINRLWAHINRNIMGPAKAECRRDLQQIEEELDEAKDYAAQMELTWKDNVADLELSEHHVEAYRAEVERLKEKLFTEHESLKWEVDRLRAAIQRHRDAYVNGEFAAMSADEELWAALEVTK